MKVRLSLVAAGIAAAIVLTGCKKDEPAAPPPATPPPTSQAPAPTPPPPPPQPAFAITEIQTVKMVGDDTSTAQPTASFAPTDDISVLVFSSGTGSHALGARWTYGADRQAVHQEDGKIEATGASQHRFKISNPAGWPTGDYQVEILVDGVASGNRAFKVE